MMTPNPHPGPQQPQPASPGPEGAPPTSSPPSSFDESLLTALFDPSQSLLTTAAARGLSLLDLARWLAQPHIQAQVEQIQALLALDRQSWADRCRDEAAEALRQAMQEATDPAERRRCANTLLRAITPPRPPRSPAPPRTPLRHAAQGAAAPTTHPATSVSPNHPLPHLSPPSPSVAPSLRPSVPSYQAALATLRELGYDTTEDELTDDELDALEDAQLDAELDAELDHELDHELDDELDDEPDLFHDELTEADLARVEALLAHHRAHHRANTPIPTAPDTS